MNTYQLEGIIWVPAYGDGNDEDAWCVMIADENATGGYTLTDVRYYAPEGAMAWNTP